LFSAEVLAKRSFFFFFPIFLFFDGAFSFPQGEAHQFLREFQRHQLLVRRPTISRQLVSERETLLSQLAVYLKQVKEEFQVQP
jgi:hypothetical protein